MLSISDIKTPDKDTLTFTLSGCNSSFVNALRRTILSEVATVSFNTEDYLTSDLKVIKNTSSLHNEFLLHRLGLIPVNINDVDGFNPDKYQFSLKKENNGNSELQVTTADFVVKNLETGALEDTKTFFPANPITKDNILITILKNNPTGDGEAINIEGKCSIGVGKDNSRFSPVSNVIFINKRDEAKGQKAFEDMIKSLPEKPTDTKLKTLAKKFDMEEADRYFHIDENGDPNVFHFEIESVGIIAPQVIVKSCIKKMIEKITNFSKNINAAFDSKPSSVTIRESQAVMKGYDITIEDESHTLGFLLQSYINKLEKDVFVGYMNPHPLEKRIKIRVNFNDDNINTVKSIFDKTTTYLIDTLNQLQTEFKV